MTAQRPERNEFGKLGHKRHALLPASLGMLPLRPQAPGFERAQATWSCSGGQDMLRGQSSSHPIPNPRRMCEGASCGPSSQPFKFPSAPSLPRHGGAETSPPCWVPFEFLTPEPMIITQCLLWGDGLLSRIGNWNQLQLNVPQNIEMGDGKMVLLSLSSLRGALFWRWWPAT